MVVVYFQEIERDVGDEQKDGLLGSLQCVHHQQEKKTVAVAKKMKKNCATRTHSLDRFIPLHSSPFSCCRICPESFENFYEHPTYGIIDICREEWEEYAAIGHGAASILTGLKHRQHGKKDYLGNPPPRQSEEPK